MRLVKYFAAASVDGYIADPDVYVELRPANATRYDTGLVTLVYEVV